MTTIRTAVAVQVLLIGDSGVGKTSFIWHSCGHSFVDTKPTICSVEVISHNIPQNKVPSACHKWIQALGISSNIQPQIRFVDTCGQERFSVMKQQMFMGVDVVIISFRLGTIEKMEADIRRQWGSLTNALSSGRMLSSVDVIFVVMACDEWLLVDGNTDAAYGKMYEFYTSEDARLKSLNTLIGTYREQLGVYTTTKVSLIRRKLPDPLGVGQKAIMHFLVCSAKHNLFVENVNQCLIRKLERIANEQITLMSNRGIGIAPTALSHQQLTLVGGDDGQQDRGNDEDPCCR